MSKITVRNLEPETHQVLKEMAAKNAISMEEQIRRLIRKECNTSAEHPASVAKRIHGRFAAIGGADDLILPHRTPLGETLKFDE